MSRQDRLNSEKCQLDILVPNLLSVDTKKSTESMTLKYLPYQSLNNLFLTNDPQGRHQDFNTTKAKILTSHKNCFRCCLNINHKRSFHSDTAKKLSRFGYNTME